MTRIMPDFDKWASTLHEYLLSIMHEDRTNKIAEALQQAFDQGRTLGQREGYQDADESNWIYALENDENWLKAQEEDYDAYSNYVNTDEDFDRLEEQLQESLNKRKED